MHEEYIDFAVKAKAHARLVQDALFSIESALEKMTTTSNDCVKIFRAELIRRALIHDTDKCANVVIIVENKSLFRLPNTLWALTISLVMEVRMPSTALKNVTHSQQKHTLD